MSPLYCGIKYEIKISSGTDVLVLETLNIAQAHGAVFKGKKTGSMSNAAVLHEILSNDIRKQVIKSNALFLHLF